MGRILITGFLLVAAGLGLIFLYLFEGEPSLPRIVVHPGGISQSTVSEVRIPHPALVSKDGERVWVCARIGNESPLDGVVLVNLKTNESELLVDSVEPLAWLGDSKALFSQEISRDPLWKKLLRKLGGKLTRRHATRFYCVDTASSSISILTEIESESTLVSSSVSPDARWMVATWGPSQVHEVSLETGEISPRLDEKYVWAPCFVDNDTYLFVGETSLQSRKVGTTSSERASQPLLQEIRDAIKLKGTPSIEICGRIGGTVYAIDHVPDARFDRLLRLDERTRVMQEITQLAPSRTLPDFSADGLYMVYQGNPFDRTQDTVYFQEVLEGAKPTVLIEGISGQVNEADPAFLPGDRVLFVHRGTELRSIHPNEEQPTLHWPQSLLP